MQQSRSEPVPDRPLSRDKARRQLRILDLVRDELVMTQENLVERLRDLGLQVTQATVSRDIKELGLVKATGPDGRQHYTLDARRTSADEKLLRICRESILSVAHSENIVVVNTLAAMADAVAEAIDTMRIDSIIGTIAGERTVLVVVGPKETAPTVAEKLRSLAI